MWIAAIVLAVTYIFVQIAVELRYISTKAEKDRIIHACHADPTSGHMGVKRTANRVTERFFWKGVTKDVEKFVRH